MNDDDPEDKIAFQAEAYDDALVTGAMADPDYTLPDGANALAAYMAARRTCSFSSGSGRAANHTVPLRPRPLAATPPSGQHSGGSRSSASWAGAGSGSFFWRSTPR